MGCLRMTLMGEADGSLLPDVDGDEQEGLVEAQDDVWMFEDKR
jgi:hypothetical protein